MNIPNSVKVWQSKYEEARDTLKDLFVEMEFFKDDRYALPPEELTDIGFLFREIGTTLDAARKEYKKQGETIELLLCKNSVDAALQAGFEDSIARLTYKRVLASCKPDIQVQPKIPKRGSPEYAELCRWAGVPEEEISKGYVTFHFPTLTKMLTENAEKGLPNPPGINDVIPKYCVTFRRRNGE